jgi:predicted DNA-binding transcriptional regulator AlpA
MTSIISHVETLLTEDDIARITGMSLGTVRRWRLLNQGPPYLKLNSAVRYRPSDLAEWLNNRPVRGEAA